MSCYFDSTIDLDGVCLTTIELSNDKTALSTFDGLSLILGLFTFEIKASPLKSTLHDHFNKASQHSNVGETLIFRRYSPSPGDIDERAIIANPDNFEDIIMKYEIYFNKFMDEYYNGED